MNRKSVFRVGIFLAFFVGFTAFNANAQGVKITRIDDVQSVEDTTVYKFVEVMPEFPGGMNALMKFLQDNIVYPKEARAKNWEGRALIGFVVTNDGTISEVAVQESSGYPILDEEAVRVVKLMPKWKPGKQNGKYVYTRFQLPIVFKLN